MKANRMVLFLRMTGKLVAGFLLIALLLFLSAGTLSYVNGWILLIALGIPMLLFSVYLLLADPDTLARRLKSKEPDKSQRLVIAVSGLIFVATFLLAGLDFRWGWSQMPFSVTLVAVALLLLGYGMFITVILQNAYASRVVEVMENQKLITGGLYGLVRHPMYTATLLIFISMPLVLGSYFALLPMLAYPPIIVRRIKNEEALLCKELAGYAEFTKTTRYRLLPFIW